MNKKLQHTKQNDKTEKECHIQSQNQKQGTRPNSCQSEEDENLTISQDDKICAFLVPRLSQPQIGANLVSKAVSWLQINGWNRNVDFETKLTSIAYFYVYLANQTITKSRLESILPACLFLASKIVRRPVFSMDEIISLVDESRRLEILQEEEKIAQILDWNLWLSFQASNTNPTLDMNDDIEKVHFLVDLLLLKNSDPLTQQYLINKIQKAAEMRVLPKNYFLIQKLLKKNSAKTLIQFYNSKFNVNQYLSFFNLE